MAGTCECSNGPSGSTKCEEISLLSENRLASQKGLWLRGISKCQKHY